MRLGIDSNMLQSPDLETFLACRKENFAVLPDLVWFEIYKQADLNAVLSGLNILLRFPDQVIVTQNGHHISGLDPSSRAFNTAILMPGASGRLREMSDALRRARAGEPAVFNQLTRLWADAASLSTGMFDGVDDIVESMTEMAAMFTVEEVRRIRTEQKYTPEMTAKTFGAAGEIYEVLCELRGYGPHTRPTMFNAYLYRFALGMCLYLIWWIRHGNQTSKKKERVRNDVVDLGIAVTASYFDGLLTNDAKARWLYDELRSALAFVTAADALER